MSLQHPHKLNRGKLSRARGRLPALRLKYYYIIAMVRGRRFCASVPGSPKNMQEARRAASIFVHKSEDLKYVPWDVIESEYKDANHVTRTLRHRIWENTYSIDEAMQRMRHKA